jgi:hypothetical protein
VPPIYCGYSCHQQFAASFAFCNFAFRNFALWFWTSQCTHFCLNAIVYQDFLGSPCCGDSGLQRTYPGQACLIFEKSSVLTHGYLARLMVLWLLVFKYRARMAH